MLTVFVTYLYFLGLRNLTIIRDCIHTIQKTEPTFQINQIPLQDEAVYCMMANGNTLGVFQFESAGMRHVLQQMQPKNIEDLTAALSLYRPGPRDSIPQYLENRKHPEQIIYAHPLLKPILSVTFGCIIYQEQVMEICRVLAGYSYGRADRVRRAMSKKKQAEMEAERKVFLYGLEGECCGALQNGIPQAVAESIFDEINRFAAYAFNKSHAVAYSHLAYQTAYLKCHYFSAYMAALMTSVMGDMPKLLSYITACQKAGVAVLPPHVNESTASFTSVKKGIRFGLNAVKNVGAALIEKLEKERAEHGLFSSLFDFCERLQGIELNKRALESLIQSGALDGLGWNRRQMLLQYEQILSAVKESAATQVAGQMQLFGDTTMQSERFYLPQPPDVAEFTESELLHMEKEVIGMYVSGNPLQSVQYLRQLLHTCSSTELHSMQDKMTVQCIGTIQQVKSHTTKSNEKMCFLQVEDTAGLIDCIVFPAIYRAVATKLKQDNVIWLKGTISQKENAASVLCESILTIDELKRQIPHGTFCIKVNSTDIKRIQWALETAQTYAGETRFCFYLLDKKQMVQSKQVQSIAVREDSHQAFLQYFSEEELGLL